MFPRMLHLEPQQGLLDCGGGGGDADDGDDVDGGDDDQVLLVDFALECLCASRWLGLL